MAALKNKMVLHLTSLSTGGGSTFTMDFHRKCLEYGYESYVVVRGQNCLFPDGAWHNVNKTKRFYWNKLRRFLFRQIVKHSRVDDTYAMYNLCERFTCYSANDILASMPKKPDVIFVHWVSDFVNAKVVRDLEVLTGAKIVFMLVDHALYSGGCHYQLDCEGYKDGCRNCPATTSCIVQKGIERNYSFKKKHLPYNSYIIANKSEESRLRESEIYKSFRVEKLIFPFDESRFCPSEDRDSLRKKWRLPIDAKVVLSGASHLDEPRKGMDLLMKALPLINVENVVVLLAGNGVLPAETKDVRLLGRLNEQQLVEAYQMADVFACPTIADAGPMMVQQSMMCGTPVVAFPVGVSSELVETGKTGYLADYAIPEDLARGIDRVLSLSKEEWKKMSDSCRETAVRLFSNQTKGNTIDDLIHKLT